MYAIRPGAIVDPAGKPRANRMYVLVISSNANARRLYVTNLVARGYLAVGVASLEQAYPLIAQHRPGLTVLCQLPLADEPGVRAVLADETLRDTPLVVASIDGRPPDWLSAAGPASYLPYPPDFARLVELVEQATGA